MESTPSFPFFSLPHVLCDLADLIWKKGTLFEAMTDHTVSPSDILLRFSGVFLSCKANATDVTDGGSMDNQVYYIPMKYLRY